ncbi:hypothetical protein BGX23_003773, partial [Mortierella sp. AD031]
ANTIFEQQLTSYRIPQASSVLYLDGPSPEEKRRTCELRMAKRTCALDKAEACIADLERVFKGGGKFRKEHFRKLTKHINAAFYLSLDSRKALARYLRDKGWKVVECPSEADIAIASDCQPGDVVVSSDSDMLLYASVETRWRPLTRGRFLVYELSKVLKHLEMSRAQLTVLDPEIMVQRYLAHGDVTCKNPCKSHFDAALRVFVHWEFSLPDPDAPPQAPSQESAVLENVLRRLDHLRLQLRESQKSAFVVGQTEQRLDVFNRYSTVDRLPDGRPLLHTSGKKYKYRQRYSIKTRSRLKVHDPPDSMKQHEWKPWTTQPESPLDPSASKLKAKSTRPPRS